MEKLITILNSISFLVLLATIVILLAKIKKQKNKPYLLLAFALFFLLTASITNIIEHLGLSEQVDYLEDILKILFIPMLIFSIHNTIINDELEQRKIGEKKFKAIFNQAFTFIGLLDKDGKIIEANDASLSFIGNNVDEIKGSYFKDNSWWSPSPIEQKKIVDAITLAKSGKTVRFETIHKDFENNTHYIDFSLKPVFDNNRELIYLIPEGHDITDIKLARIELEHHKNHLEQLVKERTEELEVMNEEVISINEELYDKNLSMEQSNKDLIKNKEALEKTLEKLNEAQDQLIESEKMASIGILMAGIAHEINNPINFISSGTIGLRKSLIKVESLCESYKNIALSANNSNINNQIAELELSLNKGKNIEAIKVLLGHIQTGIDRTVEIVSSLKYFMRNSSDKKTVVDIHDIINSVLIILHNEYKHKAKIIKYFTLKEEVNCISGKINQVIMNTLINAIQSIALRGSITIKTYKQDKNAVISIADTGEGIPKQIIKKIFDPFFTTKPVGKGTGLGLAISYTIIKEHKGKIVVNSSEGNGTEFIISIPIK